MIVPNGRRPFSRNTAQLYSWKIQAHYRRLLNHLVERLVTSLEQIFSDHVTLSFAGAQEVIAKGWGERHRLSGTSWIHLGYTMVYVPKTVEETKILVKIFQAGNEHMKSV